MNENQCTLCGFDYCENNNRNSLILEDGQKYYNQNISTIYNKTINNYYKMGYEHICELCIKQICIDYFNDCLTEGFNPHYQCDIEEYSHMCQLCDYHNCDNDNDFVTLSTKCSDMLKHMFGNILEKYAKPIIQYYNMNYTCLCTKCFVMILDNYRVDSLSENENVDLYRKIPYFCNICNKVSEFETFRDCNHIDNYVQNSYSIENIVINNNYDNDDISSVESMSYQDRYDYYNGHYDSEDEHPYDDDEEHPQYCGCCGYHMEDPSEYDYPNYCSRSCMIDGPNGRYESDGEF